AALRSGRPARPKKIAKGKQVNARPQNLPHGSRASYPRFFRQGNHLVRVAWSRREGREYTHKVTRAVMETLTVAIARPGADGRVFSTDQLLPLRDPEGGGDVPSYQAYVGISLLKQTGLIDQHGRRGYSIPRVAEFSNAVKAVWEKLPDR